MYLEAQILGWGRFWVDSVPVWDRFGIDLGCVLGIWGRFGIDLGSVWDQFGLDLGSVWGRFGVGLGSIWWSGGFPFTVAWAYLS